MKQYEYYEKIDFNPTDFALKSAAEYERHRSMRENLYVNRLNIPAITWKGARVLEVGPSAGENALLLAQQGARLTLVEPVKKLGESLRSLFSYYGQEDSIEQLISSPIEEIEFKHKFEVVIAEGFVNTLENRSDIMRKLFGFLVPNGLLIISTSDRSGAMLEYFKTALARVASFKIAADKIDEKVKAVAAYFEEDFLGIAASRSFQSYAKDMYFSPSVTVHSSYAFDQAMHDLEQCKPYYHSSYPSYAPINDLVWFKNVPSQQELFNRAIECYHFRSASFVLAHNRQNQASCETLLSENASKFRHYSQRLVEALFLAGDQGNFSEFLSFADELIEGMSGELAQTFKEMRSVAKDPSPITYKKCQLLRKYWGAPAHYIVFRKGFSS